MSDIVRDCGTIHDVRRRLECILERMYAASRGDDTDEMLLLVKEIDRFYDTIPPYMRVFFGAVRKQLDDMNKPFTGTKRTRVTTEVQTKEKKVRYK